MSARAIWKAEICLEEHRIPVKLYSAVQDRNLHFNLLHEPDQTRVRQRMIHPGSGREVPADDIQKGFPLDRQRFVVLDDEDLAELEPAPSREITVLAFVDPELLNHQWYERPYWLGPDGDEPAYFALSEALAASGQEGIARWTMRGSRYLGALHVHEDYILLETLRYADEVIDGSALPSPQGRDLTPQEKKMAGQLIEALADDFDAGDYHDEYRARVLEFVEAKRRGESIEVEEYEPEEEPESLRDSLAASLRSMKKR